MTTGFVQRFKGKIRAQTLYLGSGGFFAGGTAGNRQALVFTNAGAPVNGTSGTLANIALPGELLVDITNKALYQNTNTSASPTWTIFESSGGVGNFTNVTLTGLLTESFTDNISAAGTTQPGATALTTEVNRITTCAANAGVALPTATAGLTILVINHGANALQVYGNNAAGDQIDDVATGTGVTQMVGSMCLYTCTTTGKWYTEGLGTGYSGSLQTLSFADGLSANSGGVQSGATPITTAIARFTTVGGAGYSSLLPAAAPGLNITVINAGANAMNVFPAGSDAINALSASAAFSLPVGGVCEFFATVAGHWHTVLGTSTTTGTGAQVLQTGPTITNPVLNGPVPNAVGSTLAVTAAMAGSAILLNTGTGSVATLPAATGSGNRYRFFVSTTIASNSHKILAASSSDNLAGVVTGQNANTAKCFQGLVSSGFHSLQMPSAGTTPSGGNQGDWFEFEDVAANLWSVRGMYTAGTTPTTPFSTATS